MMKKLHLNWLHQQVCESVKYLGLDGKMLIYRGGNYQSDKLTQKRNRDTVCNPFAISLSIQEKRGPRNPGSRAVIDM